MAATDDDRMTDSWKLSATELATRFTDGRLSPVDALETSLARIARINPKLNAVIALNPTARQQAAASAARHAAGRSLGPLDGIPFTVKDNLVAAGLPTFWGGRAFENHAVDGDELPVARLRAAGAIAVAKTNVPEFALEGYTANALFGVTGNPWNPALTPGGSSGGAVCSVAAGMVPFAVVTDGGGSVRRPAGHGGLFGIKPTLGRIARHGGLPQILLDMEVVAPMTRTVADAATIFRVLAGPDVRDPSSRLPAEPGFDIPLDEPPPPLRIRYVDRFGEAPVDPDVVRSVAQVAETLAALGHEVEAGPLPIDIAWLNGFWTRISQVGLAWLRDTLGTDFDKASPKFRALADEGNRVPPAEFFAGLNHIRALRSIAAEVFESLDLILTPCAAAQPWPADVPYPTVIDGREVGPRGHAIFTGWVNAIGHPAVSVPGPPAPDGMPVGAHLVGGCNQDWQLLRLSRQFEQAAPWAERWPAVATAG